MRQWPWSATVRAVVVVAIAVVVAPPAAGADWSEKRPGTDAATVADGSVWWITQLDTSASVTFALYGRRLAGGPTSRREI